MVGSDVYFDFIKIFFSFLVFFNSGLQAHGFHSDTLVKSAAGDYSWTICQTARLAIKGEKQLVASYDVASSLWVANKVKSGAFAQSNCYCRLGFDEHPSHDILCAPSQLFYSVADDDWVAACDLIVGDELLSQSCSSLQVKSIELIEEPITFYILQVEDTHTFLVGCYSIVAHNMIVPVTMGVTIPFSTGCGGLFGVSFGHPGLIGGICFGAIIGCIIEGCRSKPVPEYRISYDPPKISDYIQYNNSKTDEKDKKSEGKAPGKPTENDGFIPKKNWDGKKVEHPKNGGVGWPDDVDMIWIPSGLKGHGGPHWDRVHKSGKKYDNVYPGGKVRPGKK